MDYKTKWMQLAIELADSVKGSTYPNPPVGAVIVKDDKEISRGVTQPTGGSHAEVIAISAVNSDLIKGTDLFVTLEPCVHYGKTPPCADKIILAGIKRVYIGYLDPNPIVNGKGVETLRGAGILVEEGLLHSQNEDLYKEFKKYILTGMPFITLKYAMTLDGKIASDSGDSKWITSDSSLKIVHQLRKENSAILIGKNTVMHDDPLLTVRRLEVEDKFQPARIVISKSGDLDYSKKIFNGEYQTILFTGNVGVEKKEGDMSFRVEILEESEFNFENIFKRLAELGFASILVEGGKKIISTVLKENLFDKILVFIAPKIIGGENYSPVGYLGIDEMKNALLFKGEWKTADGDIFFEGSL